MTCYLTAKCSTVFCPLVDALVLLQTDSCCRWNKTDGSGEIRPKQLRLNSCDYSKALDWAFTA